MDNAWKTLKIIIIILFLVYFVSFLIYSDFLINFNFNKIKSDNDFSRYLFKILKIE